MSKNPPKDAQRRILGIFKTSGIHSIGTFLNKLLLLSLVPLYSYLLPTQDTGLIGLMDTAEQFLIALLILGQGQAFVWQYKQEPDRKTLTRLVSTSVWFMLLVSILGIGGLVLFASKTTPLILNTAHPLQGLAFGWLMVGLFFRNLQSLAVNYLRADRKAISLETANLVGTALFVGLNFVLLAWFKVGVSALFVTRLLLLLPVLVVAGWFIRPYLRFVWDATLLKKMLRYGLPITITAMAYPILNFADRYMIATLLDPSGHLNGIYEISYKFGMIPSMLLVGPFLQAWQPALYDKTDEQSRNVVYRRLLLYVTFAAAVLWLGLSVMQTELLHIFSKPAYYSGSAIIPWVAASNVFYGLGWIVVAGLAVQAKTVFMGVWTALAALLNILLNFWWLPIFGMMGAAYATTAAFIFIFIGFAGYSKLKLKITFPYVRWLGLCVMAVAGYGIVITLVNLTNVWLSVVVKGLLCLPVILGMAFWVGLRNPKDLFNLLKQK